MYRMHNSALLLHFIAPQFFYVGFIFLKIWTLDLFFTGCIISLEQFFLGIRICLGRDSSS